MRVCLQPSFNTLLVNSAVAATFFLSLPVSLSRAEFLDDLFGDDTPSFSRSTPRATHQRGDDTQSQKSTKHANAQHRKPVSKLASHQADDDGDAEDNKQKNVKFDLCTDQTAQRTDAQKPDAYLYDKDLKKGDSVMTPSGVLVFKGNSGCPHRAEDFVALSSANAPKGSKKALATIDAAAKTNWK